MKRRVSIALAIALIGDCYAYGAYVNSRAGLNIRSAPDINSEVIGTIGFGQEVEGRLIDGWVEIDNGFVCSDYLQDDSPLDNFKYLGEWSTTAYAWTGMPCANGEYPEIGYTIACNSLPLGTEVFIEDIDFRIVEDRGPSDMPDEWLDLYLEDTLECVQYGEQTKHVWVSSPIEDGTEE